MFSLQWMEVNCLQTTRGARDGGYAINLLAKSPRTLFAGNKTKELFDLLSVEL
jgi:hypothetical protein